MNSRNSLLTGIVQRSPRYLRTDGRHSGVAAQALKGTPVRLVTVRGEDTASAKVEVVKELGPKSVLATGNGRNDRLMLAKAALGTAVLGPEGVSPLVLAAV